MPLDRFDRPVAAVPSDALLTAASPAASSPTAPAATVVTAGPASILSSPPVTAVGPVSILSRVEQAVEAPFKAVAAESAKLYTEAKGEVLRPVKAVEAAPAEVKAYVEKLVSKSEIATHGAVINAEATIKAKIKDWHTELSATAEHASSLVEKLASLL